MEGQGDLVSRLIMGITRVIVWFLGVISLLSPADPASRLCQQIRVLGFQPRPIRAMFFCKAATYFLPGRRLLAAGKSGLCLCSPYLSVHEEALTCVEFALPRTMCPRALTQKRMWCRAAVAGSSRDNVMAAVFRLGEGPGPKACSWHS